MPASYEDGSFSTAAINGDDRVDRPFAEQGDSATQVIYRPMIVNRANYAPLALNTAHPTVATAYLVNERNFQDAGCDVMTFERVYAQIPAARRRPSGDESFQFPGLTTTAVDPTERAITSGTFSSGTTLTLTTSTAHTLDAGDFLFISMQYKLGNSTSTTSFIAVALAGTTGSTVVIAFTYSGGTPTFNTSGFSPFLMEGLFPGRSAFTRSVTTVTDFEYFLPGVTPGITDLEDVQPEQPYLAVSRTTGATVSSLSGADASAYRQLVISGGYLTSASKVLTYRGNILVRETRRVKAL